LDSFQSTKSLPKHLPTHLTMPVPANRNRLTSVPSCGAGGHQRVVFLLRLSGQQHPQGIHTDGCSQRNVEK